MADDGRSVLQHGGREVMLGSIHLHCEPFDWSSAKNEQAKAMRSEADFQNSVRAVTNCGVMN